VEEQPLFPSAASPAPWPAESSLVNHRCQLLWAANCCGPFASSGKNPSKHLVFCSYLYKWEEGLCFPPSQPCFPAGRREEEEDEDVEGREHRKKLQVFS